MSDYRERVREEQRALEMNVLKLGVFLNVGDNKKNVSDDEWKRLHAQYNAMDLYDYILKERIRHFKPVDPVG